ncbi:MAG TPA: hypothetical protein VGJ77_07575 [Gaiellaceae bacterium]|jgi:hypothetical protein
MGDMEIPYELIDQLLGEYEGPEQLTGRDGLINRLRKRPIERAAGAGSAALALEVYTKVMKCQRDTGARIDALIRAGE